MISYQNLEDEKLYKFLKKGDYDAFKVLFKKYYQNLCYFSLSIVKEKQFAEEVVSDVFINVWEKKDKLEIKIKVKPYLYAAVRNRSLNFLKSNQLHSERLDSVDQIALAMLNKTDDNLHYEELKQLVDNLIDTLPEKRKLIFRMNRFDELSTDEIAEVLSISVSTVRNQLLKAVKQMNSNYPLLRKIYPNN